jgi:hypothetical protein
MARQVKGMNGSDGDENEANSKCFLIHFVFLSPIFSPRPGPRPPFLSPTQSHLCVE